MTHQVHVSSLSAQVKRPYPPGYRFPAPFGRRPSLLGPSCARCGVEPPFRRSSGLLDQSPDHNGIAAFCTSEIRPGWVLPVLRGRGVLAWAGAAPMSRQERSGSCFSTQHRRRDHRIPAIFFDEASTEVNSRSPVRSSLCPVRLDGSGSPWASPLCCRTLRYLALAGVRDWPGHWLEHNHESCSLKLVQRRVATSPQNRACDCSPHTAQANCSLHDSLRLMRRRFLHAAVSCW